MEVRSKAAIKGALTLAIISLGISAITISGMGFYRAPGEHAVGKQRSGAAVFAQTCVRCHGSDGRARTAKGRAVGATDLTSADWIPDTARDTRIVTRGKENMPSFKAKLKPAEIEAVVNYIRRFKG
jgi:mono/diheme cytochrome c family protein